MKRLASFAAVLLIGSTGLALAQNAAPTVAANSTPGAGEFKIRNPKIKEIVDRIQLQESRIDAGLKNNKLSADEAAGLRAKLVAVRDEIKADFKANRENGQRGLTEDQIKQLNIDLDANSTAIHDDKQAGADLAAVTATPSK